MQLTPYNQEGHELHTIAPQSLCQETGGAVDAVLVLRAHSIYRMQNASEKPDDVMSKLIRKCLLAS